MKRLRRQRRNAHCVEQQRDLAASLPPGARQEIGIQGSQATGKGGTRMTLLRHRQIEQDTYPFAAIGTRQMVFGLQVQADRPRDGPGAFSRENW